MSNEKDQPNDNAKEQALERALSLARVLTIGGDQDSINVPRSFPAGPGLLKTVPVISLILIFPPHPFNNLRSFPAILWEQLAQVPPSVVRETSALLLIVGLVLSEPDRPSTVYKRASVRGEYVCSCSMDHHRIACHARNPPVFFWIYSKALARLALRQTVAVSAVVGGWYRGSL